MKLLLDTHAFLWFIGGNPNLGHTAMLPTGWQTDKTALLLRSNIYE